MSVHDFAATPSQIPPRPTGDLFPVPPAAVSQTAVFGQPPTEDRFMKVQCPTPEEQAVLAQVGWQPGDKVPRDISQRLGNSKTVDFGAAAALKVEVAQARDIDMAQQEAQTRQMAPGVQEALNQIRSGQVPKLEIENDLAGKTSTVSPAALPAAETDRSAACPQCGWDLSQAEAEPATEHDKFNYRITLLGGQPFRKVYTLMNGQLVVTLRCLSLEEMDVVSQQCAVEQRRLNLTWPQFLERGARYRLVLQLERLEMGENCYRFPTNWAGWRTAGFSTPTDDDTLLPAILTRISKQLLGYETLYRVLLNVAGKFNRLTARLEANIENADFWPATSSPG